MKNVWTLNKPMSSLSTCHLGILLGMAILLNLVKLYSMYIFSFLLVIMSFLKLTYFIPITIPVIVYHFIMNMNAGFVGMKWVVFMYLLRKQFAYCICLFLF